MAQGNYLVQGDMTTCGGKIIEGATDHTLFGKAVARERDKVTCGKHPGTYLVAGGIDNDTVHGRKMAGTLDSVSTCPCQARFIPSMVKDTYETGGAFTKSTSSLDDLMKKLQDPYINLHGDQSSSYVSDYPALKNTRRMPDENVRSMLSVNRHEFMLLTLEECQEIIDEWDFVKNTWVNVTNTSIGDKVKTYGTNIHDVLSTSKVIYKLGGMGITATIYVNHKGTELIKISGYSGLRKILNAPVFATTNPKVIEAGLGKYGLNKSIIEGSILGFIYVSVVDTIDFILNDEVSLSKFIGTLATDYVKVGVSSAFVWTVGTYMVTSFIVLDLAIVVVAGIGGGSSAQFLDKKLGVTDKLVEIISPYIESAQQEFAEKSKEISDSILDLGAMYVDGMLRKGREVIESEVEGYIRSAIGDLTSRIYTL